MEDRIIELKEEYFSVSRKKRMYLLGLVLLLAATIGWSMNVGPSGVKFATVLRVVKDLFVKSNLVTDGERVIVLLVRFPRIAASILAGVLLANSGLLMQGIFQNPLVSPYTMGISHGASFGASLAIVFSSGLAFLKLGDYLTPAFAFIFAVLTMFLVQRISSMAKDGNRSLLLAGVAIGYLFSALVSLIKYTSDADKLPDLIFWQMGDVAKATWPQIVIMLAACIPGIVFMMVRAWDLNVMATGEESAVSLGVNYKTLRKEAFIISTLMTGAAVSFTGIIGFVGMVAPHLARMIVGNDYRYTIPTASLCGAILLLGADSLCRVIVTRVSLPIGVITSMIGVPFFLWMVVNKKQEV